MPNLSEILIYTGEIPLSLIIWSLFIGVTLAIIASFFIKVKFGAFVNSLLKLGADTPEKAITLEQCGLKSNIFVKIGLRSRSNYRNLLVAITDDGKFYANEHLTLVPPVFKDFVVIRKKRKESAIKNSEPAEKEETIEESALSKRLRLEEEKKQPVLASENDEEILDSYLKMTAMMPKERVKFNIKSAKYYIPEQLHDRAASLFTSTPTLFIQVILGILALGILALAAEPIINLLMDFLGDLIQ